MRSIGKKLLSILLSFMMALGVIAVGGGNIRADAATFADLNQSSVWIKQSQSGPCVLDACAMMIRRTLIGTGNTNWSSVTESSLKGTACQSGSWSVYYSFDYMGVSVRHTSFDGTASSLKSILNSHPEGIVLFSRSKGHAVLVTDYSGDTFYCADSAYGDKRNLNSANQGVSYSNSSEYWYVASPSITITTGNNPQGVVDIIEGKEGGVFVRGWAFDRDSPSSSIKLHVYIGSECHEITANTERSDVNSAYGISGNHGYSTTISTGLTGSQLIQVYALNMYGEGSNVLIGQGTVSISEASHNPFGVVDKIEGREGGIFIRGWAFDEDSLSTSIYLHVYIGGKGYQVKADTYRADVDNVYNCGQYHGFSTFIATNKTGNQHVEVNAINVGGGTNVLLGAADVNITHDGEAPVIKDFVIKSKDSNGFTVECTFTDNVSARVLSYCTWTDYNGRDDELWKDATLSSDSKALIRVDISDHNNESGLYVIHMYGYDSEGVENNGKGNACFKHIRVRYEKNGSSVTVKLYTATPEAPTVSLDKTSFETGEDVIVRYNTPTDTERFYATIKCLDDGSTVVGPKYEIPVGASYSVFNISKVGTYELQFQAGNSFGSSSVVTKQFNVLAKTYKLTYNANGGSNPPANQTGNGSITISSSKPTRDGYTFKKWNTKSDGTGTSYNPGATYNLTANTTLYAIWQKNETPENPDNPPAAQPKVSIKNYTASRSESYKTTITFTALTENAPAGSGIHWFINGSDKGTGETYTVEKATNNYTVQTKLIASDGSVLSETEIETVKISNGFFARLIALFKQLFGSLPVKSQSIEEE